MSTAPKQALIDELRAELAREIDVLKQAAHSAREAATHEEAKPENDKDTRAVEAAYLAGAQATRVRDLERARNALSFLELRAFSEADPVAQSALVEVEADGVRAVLFIAPTGGGMRGRLGGREVQVITPQSPLGQLLLGRSAGDVFELRLPSGSREYEILRVW